MLGATELDTKSREIVRSLKEFVGVDECWLKGMTGANSKTRVKE